MNPRDREQQAENDEVQRKYGAGLWIYHESPITTALAVGAPVMLNDGRRGVLVGVSHDKTLCQVALAGETAWLWSEDVFIDERATRADVVEAHLA